MSVKNASSPVLRNVTEAIPWFPTPLSNLIYAFVALPHTSKMYQIGGCEKDKASKAIMCCDLTKAPIGEAKWERSGEMPTACSFTSMAIVDNIIYGIDNGQVLDTVRSYDFKTGTLTTILPLRHLRYGHVIVACNKILYVFGGDTQAGMSVSCEPYDAQGEMFDTQAVEKKWCVMPPMNRWRMSCGALAYEDKIYAMGGLDDNNTFVDECECFDPITQKWTTLKPMNISRPISICVLVPHFDHTDVGKSMRVGTCMIAVLGGCANYGADITNQVELYDIVNDRWCIAPWTLPTPRIDFSAFVVGGDTDACGVVVCGGYEDDRYHDRYHDRCDMLTVATGEWTPLQPLPSPWHSAAFTTSIIQ